MARPLRILYPNAFYHVTCRGNDRRVIFRDDHDRTRFLEQLRNAIQIFSVRVAVLDQGIKDIDGFWKFCATASGPRFEA